MSLRDGLLLALCNIVWGLNAVAVKVAVEQIDPLTAGAFRFGLLLVACLPWLRWLPGRMTMVLAASLVNGVLYLGLVNIAFAAADNVSALAAVQPISVPFSLLLAILLLKERVRWVRVGGMLLSFVGVVVMSFDPAIADERVGLALIILASFTFAAGSLQLRRLADVPPLTTYAWLALIGTPVMLAGSLLFEPGELSRSIALPWTAFLPIAFSAFASSLLGQVGMASLLQRYPVSTLAPLTLPATMLAILATAVWFGAEFTPRMVAGGMLVLLGVAVITLRSAYLSRRRAVLQ
jgi:O-acetylserine/cysteine efflux transporter